MLAAADMLQLHEVVDGCCEFLCRELHASNALGILRFAEAHNCEALAKSALNFVHANFPAVSTNIICCLLIEIVTFGLFFPLV